MIRGVNVYGCVSKSSKPGTEKQSKMGGGGGEVKTNSNE